MISLTPVIHSNERRSLNLDETFSQDPLLVSCINSFTFCLSMLSNATITLPQLSADINNLDKDKVSSS